MKDRKKWIEVAGRRRRKRKQLPDELKENRGFWKLKGKALYLTLWQTRSHGLLNE